jgi:hypothetical protein
VALGIVEAVEAQHGIDLLELDHNSTLYLHILIEALRLAFADSESTTALWNHSPRLPKYRDVCSGSISQAETSTSEILRHGPRCRTRPSERDAQQGGS